MPYIKAYCFGDVPRIASSFGRTFMWDVFTCPDITGGREVLRPNLNVN